MAKARSAMIRPRPTSSTPTSVGNSPGPMRCMVPVPYWCDSPMKPAATAMKNSPDQKSFGERMRITWPVTPREGAASIRLDLRLLDDDEQLLRGLFDPGIKLRRGRRDGFDAAAGEALLHVRHGEDFHHFGLKLVDDLLRRALGGQKQRPVRGIDPLGALR